MREENFQSLLERLRVQRGMSQSRLAQLAGVSNSTVYRAEAKDSKVPSPRVAAMLFRALNDASRVPLDDLRKYARLASIDAEALDPDGLIRRAKAATAALDPAVKAQVNAVRRQSQKWIDAIDTFPVKYREPFKRLMSLVEGVGEHRTMVLLDAFAAASGIGAPEALLDSATQLAEFAAQEMDDTPAPAPARKR